MSEQSEPTYCVIDVETTRNGTIEGQDGSPFDPANRVVLRGGARGDRTRTDAGHHGCSIIEPDSSTPALNPVSSRCPVRLLVGHNIGYDIHHLRKGKHINEEFLGTVSLWDTQLAEYLLEAQRVIMPSLDDLSAKYGGLPKDPDVTAIFDAGHGADKVPMVKLKPYLIGDLENTELVFIEQFKRAQEMDMLPLITTQMDALAATIEMTYNGLAVDRDALLEGCKKWGAEHECLLKKLRIIATDYGAYFKDFNPGSTKQLSTLLFGGFETVKAKEAVGLFKNGNIKYRTVTKKNRINGMGIPVVGETNGKGDHPTDDKTLNRLLDDRGISSFKREFLETLIEWREVDKQLGTYWQGILKLVMPDGCIHHRLNHTVTRTGRLSSSEPNLQNVTNGDIKKVFVSRWGTEGVIIEADFKQLEMVELAERSGCLRLLHDILSGIDMHDALFMDMHGRPMKKDERKAFKRCSFALVYGAGAKGVAEQGGVSEAEAKRFIETFYRRYPGVKAYHDALKAQAAAGREYHGLKDAATGLPMGEFTFVCPQTGRRYWFREYPTDWGTVNFSPTELKNYMVQGGATGDKVPLCIGKLYRVLRNHPTLKDKCLLINTVHDSVMFDCHKDVLELALKVIKETMEATPQFFEEAFGYKMQLPLKVELSIGPNWLEQHEVKFNASNDPDWDSVWKEAA
jgi:DNA polymerase-1